MFKSKHPDEYSFMGRVGRAAMELSVTTGKKLYNLRLYSKLFVDDMNFFASYKACAKSAMAIQTKENDCLQQILPTSSRAIDSSTLQTNDVDDILHPPAPMSPELHEHSVAYRLKTGSAEVARSVMAVTNPDGAYIYEQWTGLNGNVVTKNTEA